ncbi:SPARC-related modular calcium-binding protein 1 [Portunus trituberculatus]|uniref:SPARC-related modular calcium-binding protein 1 n=1 Tax=Portunus trituberculatus TaxID=210409 RepID=A0A5B7EK62_PORTR|nr:SPARC-related modular calcium-binding protein 1 [Portunus trituberculatus]
MRPAVLVSAVVVVVVLLMVRPLMSIKAHPCTKVCPKIFLPVCGSDLVTYVNDCEFSIAQCFNPKLKLLHRGKCKTDDKRG